MPLELAQDQHDTQSKKRYATPKRAAKDDPRLHAVEGALRYAYGPVLARALKDPAEGRLGISIPSYARACVRNAAMISQLCGELGEYWWRIAQYNAKSAGSSFKRMELQAREEAAVQLMELVRGLPQPWREVVQLRAIGLSWKDVSKALPHRAYFSLTDDWKRACTHIADRHGDVVARVG